MAQRLRFCLESIFWFLFISTSVGAQHTLSDEALLKYISTPYTTVEKTRVDLGKHRDALVVADFICSDICPAYTVRVVHYEVPENKTCASIGGVEKRVQVPVAITTREKSFCFPATIAEHWDKFLANAHIRQ